MNGSTTPPARPQPIAGLLPLNRVRAGAPARVRAFAAQSEVVCRLRELGLCEGQCVISLGGGDQMICLVRSARLALSGRLAACVLVEAAPGDVKSNFSLWQCARAFCRRWLRSRQHNGD